MKQKTRTKVTASTVKKEWVPKKAKEVLSRKNADGTISVLHLENENFIFSIHGIAIDVWTMINGHNSIDNIETTIIKKYSPPPKQLSKDLQNFMLQLVEKNLIAADS